MIGLQEVNVKNQERTSGFESDGVNESIDRLRTRFAHMTIVTSIPPSQTL
jgi:hypothetical protein